jgi:hypothetical protein
MGFAEPTCHQAAGELLPHRFTLTAAVIAHVGLAVYSLLHFPSGRPAWPLASILLFGVRTFLDSIRPGIYHPGINQAAAAHHTVKMINTFWLAECKGARF